MDTPSMKSGGGVLRPDREKAEDLAMLEASPIQYAFNNEGGNASA